MGGNCVSSVIGLNKGSSCAPVPASSGRSGAQKALWIMLCGEAASPESSGFLHGRQSHIHSLSLIQWCVCVHAHLYIHMCLPEDRLMCFSSGMTYLGFFHVYFMCMCIYVCGHMLSKAPTWRSEDNLRESVLSVHYVGHGA